ncbi:MAG TPA: hypothetical protein PK513_09040 [Alphaproteobacteria bacterium]|nr:hypothetical protein [Alphaproteobacteria bacterium]USO05202.1 MAG: hypothetical protein H6859_08605 [Rhodospirillales bacterium]HOO82636.1 hypothetical protein [Alphaproteobacteria bacterium]
MLIVPFRNDNRETIEIRYVVPDGRPGPAALVPLTTISREVFNDYGQDEPVEAAFEKAVTAVLNKTSLPKAHDELQGLANRSVQEHAEELLTIINH